MPYIRTKPDVGRHTFAAKLYQNNKKKMAAAVKAWLKAKKPDHVDYTFGGKKLRALIITYKGNIPPTFGFCVWKWVKVKRQTKSGRVRIAKKLVFLAWADYQRTK